MRVLAALAALALLLAAAPAGAQYTRRPPVVRTVPVRVALTIAGEPAESRGDGICYHRPDFALHGKPARQWSVSYASRAGGTPVAVVLSVTVPKDAPDGAGPFAATLTARRKARRIGVGTPRPEGSGTVVPAAEGAGWRFTFAARAADGAAVTGTVTCERTSPLGGG